MNLQQQYDYVVQKLREQPFRSTNGQGVCAYRGQGGAKCAGGWLIPDDEYHSDMEGSLWPAVVENFKAILPVELHEPTSIQMVTELQVAHDTYLGIHEVEFEERLRFICQMFGLIYTPR